MKKWIGGALLAGSMLVLAARSQAQIIIIANPELKTDSISKDGVRDIFTGASGTVKGGARVKPVLLKKSPAHAEFLATYIGVDDGQFRADWMKMLFAGKLLLPASVDSEADMVAYVEQHPGMIGYIRSTTPHKGVLVLTVK